MVSTAVSDEFNWEDLLVEEESNYYQPRNISIEVTQLVDEDGDDALQVHLTSFGLDKQGVLISLELAYRSVQAGVDDDDEEDEDD